MKQAYKVLVDGSPWGVYSVPKHWSFARISRRINRAVLVNMGYKPLSVHFAAQ